MKYKTFADLSEAWSKISPGHRHIEGKLSPDKLKRIQNRVVKHAIEPVSSRTSGSLNVLDYGCGGGLSFLPFTSSGHRVYGVDISEDSVKNARSALEKLGVSAEERVLKVSPDPKEQDLPNLFEQEIDWIHCHHVVWHFLNYDHYLQVAESWVDLIPRFISISIKCGTKTFSAPGSSNYINPNIMTREDAIRPFLDCGYELIYENQEPLGNDSVDWNLTYLVFALS